jgi:hypothetical protein
MVTLRISLLCDTRQGSIWLSLDFGVESWTQAQTQRERERAAAQILFDDGSENFFWALRVRLKEGITSMTSSHRQLLVP